MKVKKGKPSKSSEDSEEAAEPKDPLLSVKVPLLKAHCRQRFIPVNRAANIMLDALKKDMKAKHEIPEKILLDDKGLPRDVDDNFKIYTRKVKIDSFFRPQHLQDYKEMIAANVEIITKWLVEFSIFVNFYWRRKVELGKVDMFRKINPDLFKRYLCIVQGKPVTDLSDDSVVMEYMKMRKNHNLPKYTNDDTYKRDQIPRENIRQFDAALKTHIKKHMFKRVWLCLRKLGNYKMDNNEMRLYVREILAGDRHDPLISDSVFPTNWRTSPYQMIPMLIKLQQKLTLATGRGFAIVPMFSHRMKHIVITNTGLFELQKQVRRQFLKKFKVKFERQLKNQPGYENVKPLPHDYKTYSKTVRNRWSEIARLEEFERNGAVLVEITTDGVSVSVVLQKPVLPKISKPKNSKYDLSGAQYLVGLDPGMRLIYGGIRVDMVTNKVDVLKMSSRQWHHDTGKNDRDQSLKNLTSKLEKKIALSRENLSRSLGVYTTNKSYKVVRKVETLVKTRTLVTVGTSHPNFRAFTNFELSNLVEKCRTYNDSRIANLYFQKYCRVKKTASDVAKDLCKKTNGVTKKKTVVFLGGAKFAADSCIKGYVRGNMRMVHEAMLNMPERCIVHIVPERNTTKCCCYCFRFAPPSTKYKDRSQRCPTCKTTLNRDVNAGTNMITKGLHLFYGADIHPNLDDRLRPVTANEEEDEDEYEDEDRNKDKYFDDDDDEEMNEIDEDYLAYRRLLEIEEFSDIKFDDVDDDYIDPDYCNENVDMAALLNNRSNLVTRSSMLQEEEVMECDLSEYAEMLNEAQNEADLCKPSCSHWN